ncbi:formylglycine-generating enzyme family protein [Streptomyces sp. NPDC008313]|uniref:formylglycine-generating enzyme family protein n=1 Tax=Streptomyces sp. NPDC008313 TaxID=3364826 RepID=UPI0036EA8594
MLLAPSVYQVLAPVPWSNDPGFAGRLRDCLLTDFGAELTALRTGHLASPATALRALSAAIDAMRWPGGGLLVLGLAGHMATYARRAGSFHALALPGTVPGRPKSALPLKEIGTALRRLPETVHVLVVADLIAADTRDEHALAVGFSGELSSAPGERLSLLMSLRTPHSSAVASCHHALALALALEEVSAAGSSHELDEVIERARVQTVAVGGRPHAVPAAEALPVHIVPSGSGEQLPDYIREDLFSTDTGSRLDAVTELAELAQRGHTYAHSALNRLARDDAAPAVRAYADTLMRQAEQPSLAELSRAGLLPVARRDSTHGQSLAPGAVPDLLPQPCGKVLIGAVDPGPGDWPQHHVDLQPFRLGRIPVTNRQYLAFLTARGGPCPDHWATATGVWQDPDLPVVMVSWYDAMRYCAWLDAHLHDAGELADDERITLPSEAEWEAAAGNGRGDAHPWGPDDRSDACNIRDTGLNRVLPAGRFSPRGDSDSGCADMIGNVWEWTRSLWGPGGRTPSFTYPYNPADGREAGHADRSIRRIIRGGAFYYATECANTYTRNRMLPTDRHPAGGFRTAAVRVLIPSDRQETHR